RDAARVVLVTGDEWTDPQHVATQVAGAVSGGPADPEWLSVWQAADKAASGAVDRVTGPGWPTGAHAARDVVAALPDGVALFLGSSNAVRFVDFLAPTGYRTVLANRGVAGIDGSVSTAAGIALGSERPCCALLGDLTFLHDVNGLLLGPDEQRPDLTVVVLNDDGGGIFALLEQGAPEHAGSFERVFGTPTGADLGALCAGYRVPYTLVSERDELAAALAPADGPRVVEIRVGRTGLRDWQAELFAAVRAAVPG
ncbi:MAG TPA: thiamine pyrophosphate-dependent enzyme, partial [Pseudonocardiaceae bacterium]|nr:thiamine pyrophosphate-dependent enzyme [Pseudonocardiaceae bacterium]